MTTFCIKRLLFVRSNFNWENLSSATARTTTTTTAMLHHNIKNAFNFGVSSMNTTRLLLPQLIKIRNLSNHRYECLKISKYHKSNVLCSTTTATLTAASSLSINRFYQLNTSHRNKVKDEKSAATTTTSESEPKTKKLGIVAQFRQMYKQYWYVLLPVHVITSTGWIFGFYYLSKSGVDIPALLHALSISESIIDKLKDSTMGHLAIAYMCYKIATPIRYMVTVGGTTISIKYLSNLGYIRPMPTKAEIKKMYDDRKARIIEEKNKDN